MLLDIKNIVACQSLEMNLRAEMRSGKSDVFFLSAIPCFHYNIYILLGIPANVDFFNR